MSILSRKSRVVNFRLSQKEYEKLRSFCEDKGAHSISDVARVALQRLIDLEGRAVADPVPHTVGTLTRRLEHLDNEVRRLSRLVEQGSTVASGS